jgi:hypothetical protein
MTQTIDIDGQTVHASAVLCREPDGIWRIEPIQDARTGTPVRSSKPAAVAQ